MLQSKPRIVIAGGNFAGLVAASRLSTGFDVTVVDARPEFEWTPNIHEILSGVKARPGVVLSRAQSVNRYGHTFLHDKVTRVDRKANSVCTAGGLVLPYDACLIAAGSQRTTFGIPGADAHSTGLRLADDAVRIGARLDTLAGRKKRASVVIVGAGVSGIEALGEILRRRHRGDKFDLHLIETAPRILPQLPKALAQDALARIGRHRVTVHTGTAISHMDARQITLTNGETLPSDLCIWSAGVVLPDFLRDAGLNGKGDDWLPVDQTLASTCADNIFIAGDCAQLPQPIRKQAYHAMDMGERAGDNMARLLQGKPLRPFVAANTPMLISFGDLTTWLVSGDCFVANPLLAAGKEAVYQTTMARLMSPQQPFQFAKSVASRAALATEKLLLPQLRPGALLSLVSGSRAHWN